MNKIITMALTAIGSAVIILFVYSPDILGIPVFDFKTHSYLVSYFLVSCIIMAIKTLSNKTGAENKNKILAVWRIKGTQLPNFARNEYYKKKLLVKVLTAALVVAILVSVYPLAISESSDVTALVSSVYALFLCTVIFMKISVGNSARKAESMDYCDMIITSYSLVCNGKIKYSWNDFSTDLISADVIIDGSPDISLSIICRKYGKRLFSIQIPVPQGKLNEALETAPAKSSLQALINPQVNLKFSKISNHLA